MNEDNEGKRKKPRSIPVEFGLPEAIAAAMAGALNDWRTDSFLISALGEGARRPRRGRRAAGPSGPSGRR
jgi:hypothetical protein